MPCGMPVVSAGQICQPKLSKLQLAKHNGRGLTTPSFQEECGKTRESQALKAERFISRGSRDCPGEEPSQPRTLAFLTVQSFVAGMN